jgi:hypothetical protein
MTVELKHGSSKMNRKPQKDMRKLSVLFPEWTRKVDQSNYNFKYFFRPSIWAVVCEEDMAIYTSIERLFIVLL